jgi:diguanylate cyclase (GGDEF)-like protein
MRGPSTASVHVDAMASPRLHSSRDSLDVRLDSAILGVYVVCFVIVLALLPLGGSVGWTDALPALVVQIIVGLLLVFGRPLGLDRVPFAGCVGIVLYLISVALLRDGASPTAGYGPLVLLPVLWASVRGRRIELAVAVAGVAAVYLAPALLLGPPQYPAGGWRAGLLFVVLSAAVGVTVMALVVRLRLLVDELVHLAGTDELTGLPNRRAWEDLLTREITRARRSHQSLVVAVLDLDKFKAYNDNRGHLAGDQLLVEASWAWQTTLRATDVLARWGGDEFVLLLPACDLDQAQTLVDRLRAACPEAPFSAGLAEWDGVSAPQALLASADEALYGAKQMPAPVGAI